MVDIASACEKNDRSLTTQSAILATYFLARNAGHGPVEHDQFVVKSAQKLQRIFPGVAHLDGKTLHAQVIGEGLAKLYIIIYN
jgi:hypothetical protein